MAKMTLFGRESRKIAAFPQEVPHAVSIPLVESGQVTPLNSMQQDAQQVFDLAIADRRGKLRLEEARYQNKIIRAVLNRTISNLPQYKRDFKDEINLILKEKPHLPVMIGGKHISLYIDGLFLGIESVVNVVGTYQHQARKAKIVRDIGMNDVIDAAHEIDLVVVDSVGGAATKQISCVHLVQVKSSPMSLTDVVRTRQAHQMFTDTLLAAAEFQEIEQLKRAIYHVDSLDFLEEEMKKLGDIRSSAKLITDLFEPFVENMYVEMIQGKKGNPLLIQDHQIETFVRDLKIPSIFLHIFFRLPASRAVILPVIGREPKFTNLERDTIVAQLLTRFQQWSNQQNVTPRDLLNLYPTWFNTHTLLEIPEIISVIEDRSGTQPKVMVIPSGLYRGLSAA